MPLLPRSTVVERPTLVDRDDSEDNIEQQAENEVIESLGDGPIVNSIQFEQGDYAVVSAANLAAVITSAETEGDMYEQTFRTAAITLKEMSAQGIDISAMSRMGRDRGVDDINVSQEDLQSLKLATQTINDEQAENEDLEDIEEEVTDEEESDANEEELNSDDDESEDGDSNDAEEAESDEDADTEEQSEE